MDRRTAIKAAVEELSNTCPDAAVAARAVAADEKLVAFVVRYDRPLAREMMAKINKDIASVFRETEFRGVPVFVLTEGMKFEAVTMTNEQAAMLEAQQ